MIGIFDSGVGGMTVAKAIEELLPEYPLLYLGDLARSPYGSKSDATLLEYSRENCRYLLDQGAKAIVIACNSASSVAADILQQELDVPLIEVITPAVNEAAAHSRCGRIGVIGTRATINSEIYARRLVARREDCAISSQACPLLVPLIEEGWLNKRETKMILRRYLHPLRNRQLDTLILGCTHYPLLKELIQPRIGKRVKLIDSSQATAHHLQQLIISGQLDLQPQAGHSVQDNRYVFTDITPASISIAQRIFGRPIRPLTPQSC